MYGVGAKVRLTQLTIVSGSSLDFFKEDKPIALCCHPGRTSSANDDLQSCTRKGSSWSKKINRAGSLVLGQEGKSALFNGGYSLNLFGSADEDDFRADCVVRWLSGRVISNI